MKYILMHKDIPVCEIEISDASFSIENVSKIYNPEHIPLGLSENEKKVLLYSANLQVRGGFADEQIRRKAVAEFVVVRMHI